MRYFIIILSVLFLVACGEVREATPKFNVGDSIKVKVNPIAKGTIKSMICKFYTDLDKDELTCLYSVSMYSPIELFKTRYNFYEREIELIE